MTVTLKGIRDVSIDYFSTKIHVSVSNFTSISGGEINSGEDFNFSVIAKNDSESDGGIKLKNIRYWIKVVGNKAKLYVPSGNIKAYLNIYAAGNALSPGGLRSHFILFPQPETVPSDSHPTELYPGNTKGLVLKAKAGSITQVCDVTILFRLYADIDLEYLFPNNKDSQEVGGVVTIHE
jgi:hypothetical protein